MASLNSWLVFWPRVLRMLRLDLSIFSHRNILASFLVSENLLFMNVSACFDNSIYNFDKGSWRLLRNSFKLAPLTK